MFAMSKSNNPRIIVKILTGKYRKNVKFRESSLDNFLKRQPTKVIPLLDIPGNKAIDWNRPIIKMVFFQSFSKCLVKQYIN